MTTVAAAADNTQIRISAVAAEEVVEEVVAHYNILALPAAERVVIATESSRKKE